MVKDKTNKRWHSDYNILFNRAAPKLCMAGFDCKSAAKCHSISVGRVLQRIAEQGKVVAVVPSETPGESVLKPQGISQVSTFSGFCSKHDQALFALIDNFDYQPETATAISTSLTLRDLMGALNAAIANDDYSMVATRILELPDEYPIAQSGSMIVDGASREGYPHMITVNVIPQQGRTYALLSCTIGHGTFCIDGHLERFRVGGILDYRNALTHIMCMAGDPIAIKPSYWEALSDNIRSSFVERLNTWMKGGVDPVQPAGSFNILQDQII